MVCSSKESRSRGGREACCGRSMAAKEAWELVAVNPSFRGRKQLVYKSRTGWRVIWKEQSTNLLEG
jgi:hypothetical protein